VSTTWSLMLESLELEGETVRKGQFLVTLIGAPTGTRTYTTTRGRSIRCVVGQLKRLAFSAGIHYCLGQPPARLEATIALRVLAERIPRLRRAPGRCAGATPQRSAAHYTCRSPCAAHRPDRAW
jgi:cytochrome P450